MGRASLTGRPEIRKRSSQSNPEANLRNRQTAVACMADPPEGRCLWHFTDRRHHLSAAGGFSEAAFGGRNTALNHVKKECALAHSRAEARLLRQPSTPAPSAHPRGAFFIVWKRSFLYENKKPAGSRIAGFLYYNERWNNHMATWNSRGLRGSTLEDLINRTNEKYLESNLALIQKIPTPITPIKNRQGAQAHHAGIF